MMNKSLSRWKWIYCVLIASLMTGCAAYGKDLVDNNTVKVEKVSSRWAKVTRVMVNQDDAGIVVRGEVQRWPPMRGPIPGHLNLEIIGPDGQMLEENTVGYHRRSYKSRYATFSTKIGTPLPAGSTIRVTHVWGD